MPPAHAKINLWLNVVGRRADGYHLLDSLIAFADLADTLEVAASDRLSLGVTGAEAGGLAQEPDNLVLKAARLLAERAGVKAEASLVLTKNIPVAAGLGGGSADAATALRALSALWRVALAENELMALAAKLGADVPMCLAGRTAIAGGIGERLVSAPALPDCGVLLVNPRVGLPTADVFRARSGTFSPPRALQRPWRHLADLVADLAERGNDLALPAISLRPVIGDVLAALRQSASVRYMAMTGSGATCFALYDSMKAARQAASSLPAVWWRHAGRFISR